MGDSEKLCLQWNDFQNIVSSAFGDLRDDHDLTDVTLACEDGMQVEAHKVVLASASPFFLEVLKRNKHPHPLIYMKGIRSDNLMAMVEFFYKGEANVFQENLDTFLALADEMRLKGLSKTDESQETEGNTKDFSRVAKPPKRTSESQILTNTPNQVVNQTESKSETSIALNGATEVVDLHQLNEKIRSMMKVGENRLNVGQKSQCWTRICTVCGEEGRMHVIKAHIEAKHITGISHRCDICGNSAKTKNSLVAHKSRYHRNNREF